MKEKLKVMAPILLFLGLGLFFGISTDKIYWYVTSGLVIGVIVSLSFNSKKIHRS